MKYNCIFGGGAVRGLCYVGTLRALEELDIEIGSIAGSSVGAVFSLLLISGYSCNEIEDLFLNFNFNTFRDINFGFSPDLSFSKGEVFLNWLREKISIKILGKKTTSIPICFKDLKKDLYIITTDLSNHKQFVFSKETTPDFEIALAVRASAAMPGLMKPLNYNDIILVDGDLSKSQPLWKADENFISNDYRVLEFRLEGSSETNIKNPIDYFANVYNAFSYLCTSNIIEKYGKKDKFDFITFDTKDLLFIDFTLPAEERKKLIEQGYRETIEYFNNTLLKKKISLLPSYEYLLNKIHQLKYCICSNNYINSLNKINEILSSSHYNHDLIDTSFNVRLYECKKELEISREKGFFSVNKIAEKSKFIFTVNKIEEDIKYKIKELKEYIENFKNNH